jgi:hypothetical protein
LGYERYGTERKEILILALYVFTPLLSKVVIRCQPVCTKTQKTAGNHYPILDKSLPENVPRHSIFVASNLVIDSENSFTPMMGPWSFNG